MSALWLKNETILLQWRGTTGFFVSGQTGFEMPTARNLTGAPTRFVDEPMISSHVATE